MLNAKFTIYTASRIFKLSHNKPKGLKVAKEDLRLIVSMVIRLDG